MHNAANGLQQSASYNVESSIAQDAKAIRQSFSGLWNIKPLGPPVPIEEVRIHHLYSASVFRRRRAMVPCRAVARGTQDPDVCA